MFFFKLPQKRHPERSASQINRVRQRLVRGVEGPRRCLSYPCCSHRSPHLAARHGLSPGPRTRTGSILLSPAATFTFSAIRTINPEFKDLAQTWGSKMITVHDVPVTIKCVPQPILFSGFGGRKGPSSMGKISTAEVLRLRATSAVSRDESVRRCAQG
jgi:hypothetical protein